MQNITKVSEITTSDLVEYLNLYEVTSEEISTLNNLLGIAKAFVKGYTGVSNLDEFQDFVIVVMMLVQDMWDTRSYYGDKTNLNNVVQSILGMHSVNLLPTVV